MLGKRSHRALSAISLYFSCSQGYGSKFLACGFDLQVLIRGAMTGATETRPGLPRYRPCSAAARAVFGRQITLQSHALHRGEALRDHLNEVRRTDLG